MTVWPVMPGSRSRGRWSTSSGTTFALDSRTAPWSTTHMSLHPAAVRAARTLTVLGARTGHQCRPPRCRRTRRVKPRPPITSEFFGVHHQGLHADGPIGWPQAPVGSVRMWDNRVSWREIEIAPGVFDWTLIDAQMAKARANGASVLLVLGQTPVFHSTRPTAARLLRPRRLGDADPGRLGPLRAGDGAAQHQRVGPRRAVPGLERGQRRRSTGRGRPSRWRR